MKTIYNGHSKKSGVYKIVNTKNNRIYIGSAKEFKERHKGHVTSLTRRTHYNKFLQNDFNKCGEDAFIFEVLEVTTKDKTERRTIEENYINKYYDDQKQCYNVRKKTIINNGPWSYTPKETREKLSIINKNAWARDVNGERRKKTSEQFKKMWEDPEYRKWKLDKQTGRKNTEEQKKRMSESAHNRKPDSEETKRIKSLAAKKRFEDPIQREHLAELSRNRKPVTEDTRRKLSEAHKGKACKEETKIKISIANKNREYKTSEYNKQRSREVNERVYNLMLINPEGKEIFLHKNLAEFCKENDVNKSSLNKLINGKVKKNKKGWHIKR